MNLTVVKRNNYAFQRQVNEKPNMMLSCPGSLGDGNDENMMDTNQHTSHR